MSVDLRSSNALRAAGTLMRLTRTLDHGVRKRLSEDNLDLVGLSTLAQVERGVDLPSLVARSLSLDPGRVTRLMDHLVDAGYVERYADTDDRRRCRLRVTDAGRERLKAGKAELADVMSGLLASLSPPDRASLESGLEAVRKALESG